jgi:3,4-dihydroxy 2-butanone 4-phosphate synthase/GTP cyclohydrolase II
MTISPIDEILAEFKQGKFVIMVDNQKRENEGDLMLAAQFVDAAKINFMLREARGMICLAITEAQADQLQLPVMNSSSHNHNRTHAAFTFSIEATRGVTTGISARERAHTMLTAINAASGPQDVVCPGHVFPIVARNGGVLVRDGHTEAAVDLATLSKLTPAAVLCEILNDDGDAATNDFLKAFCEKFSIKIGSVDDLISFRKKLG